MIRDKKLTYGTGKSNLSSILFFEKIDLLLPAGFRLASNGKPDWLLKPCGRTSKGNDSFPEDLPTQVLVPAFCQCRNFPVGDGSFQHPEPTVGMDPADPVFAELLFGLFDPSSNVIR